MAVDNKLETISLEAGQDLSTFQYRFVALASDGQIDPVGTAGAKAIGILQDKPSAVGQAGCVAVPGTGFSKVELGATVAQGAEVASDNVGRAVTAVSGNVILGICTIGGAVGDIGACTLAPAYIKA